MWFNIDFRKLAVLLLPTFLRKSILMGFVTAINRPIANLYDKWRFFREGNIYKVQHTGQVCYLRKVLNDKLDPSLRRIVITDGQRYKRQYLYTRAENKPKFLGKIFLRDRSDYEDTGVDFIVQVPNLIFENSIFELQALIDFYKACGLNYKIEIQ
jgi:hypothetical protein